MLIRATALTAVLTLAGLGFAGSAQAQYFGVDATAQTLGYAGGFTDNSGALTNATFADALSDPAGVTLSSPYYGSMFADVGAASEARPAELHAQATAHTHSINATPGFSGSAPYGQGYAHFYDRLTVRVRDRLPDRSCQLIQQGRKGHQGHQGHKGQGFSSLLLVLDVLAVPYVPAPAGSLRRR